MNDDNNTPGLSQVLGAWVTRACADIMVCKPARVVRWDAALQLVDAQPLTKNSYYDETGERKTEDWPVITNVPMCFPSSGGYGMTFPVAVGDMVLLMFADRSIDGLLANGSNVDPGEGRSHHLSDAIAIPGMHHFGVGGNGPLDMSTMQGVLCGGSLAHTHASNGAQPTWTPGAPTISTTVMVTP
jgi:hypothetical protein